MPKLTETEIKLVRLALDPAAREGEVANAAHKLFQLLRKKGINAETFLTGEKTVTGQPWENLYRQTQGEVDRLRKENAALRRDKQQLLRMLTMSRFAKEQQQPPPVPPAAYPVFTHAFSAILEQLFADDQ